MQREKVLGMHIGFTGIDGSGKSTQASLLCGWLAKKGIYNVLREGKRDFVAEISTAIARRHGISSGREYLGEDFYMVSFSFDLLREIMLDVSPYVTAGAIVVSARTPFCRLAGGTARGCSSIDLAIEIALFGGVPDLTIWIDVPPEIAYERVMKRRLDSADLDHLTKYKEALQKLLQNYKHIRIDGAGKIEEVHAKIKKVVENFLIK